MTSISIEVDADVASIDVRVGTISRSDEVGRSLLANYDAHDQLVSVELLSLAALRRQDVRDQLRALVGGPSAATDVRRIRDLIVTRTRLDVVDMLVEQISINDRWATASA